MLFSFRKDHFSSKNTFSLPEIHLRRSKLRRLPSIATAWILCILRHVERCWTFRSVSFLKYPTQALGPAPSREPEAPRRLLFRRPRGAGFRGWERNSNFVRSVIGCIAIFVINNLLLFFKTHTGSDFAAFFRYLHDRQAFAPLQNWRFCSSLSCDCATFRCVFQIFEEVYWNLIFLNLSSIISLMFTRITRDPR